MKLTPTLNILHPITWNQIFASWKKDEAHQESWKKHWEERGYDSWEQWRSAYIAPLEPEKLEWFLYEIKNPFRDVPEFHGVPSRGWFEKAYNGETTKKLKDIIHLPIVTENDKIQAIKKEFPKETMLTGIIHNNEIILVEGMHRACAIASLDKEQPFDAKVLIALAKWDKELPTVGSGCKNKE